MLQVLNLCLRALTLVSRLALLFFLARLLEPSTVGLFGLFVATVTYATLGVSLNFYTFSQREIITHGPQERAWILSHHALVTGVMYMLLLPVSMAIFVAGLLPWQLAPWLALFLFLEYVSQDCHRFLIALKRPIAAGSLLFVRQGLWIWLLVPTIWFAPTHRNLEWVLAFWAGGSGAALLLSVVLLVGLVGWPANLNWSWDWMKRGLRTAVLFLAASLALRGILTLDRFFFEGLAGADLLGAYTLYAALAMALVSFLDASVFVFRYPALVQAYRRSEATLFRSEWRKLIRTTVGVTLAMVVPAILGGTLVAKAVNRPVYSDNIDIFWLLLGAAILHVFSMIPHYGLYAMGRDRAILAAHVTGLIGFIVIALLLGGVWPRMSVPVALVFAFAWLALHKTFAFYGARHKESLAAAAGYDGRCA